MFVFYAVGSGISPTSLHIPLLVSEPLTVWKTSLECDIWAGFAQAINYQIVQNTNNVKKTLKFGGRLANARSNYAAFVSMAMSTSFSNSMYLSCMTMYCHIAHIIVMSMFCHIRIYRFNFIMNTEQDTILFCVVLTKFKYFSFHQILWKEQ